MKNKNNKQIKKILVANRGEIALRVMRSAHELGISTVAVYSEADRTSPHVLYANEAICLGPAPSNQSYLLGDKIIAEALRLGVDAIHPGYGFLSENADFAEKAEAAGITFIGPTPDAIRVMGSKLGAKEAVKHYGIPMVPGTDGAVADPTEAIAVAKKIGFPILIKASAGGGGKGMRVVTHEAELAEQMERAISEAISSFGDGSVFVEKFVDCPRHIEIQVLADKHGNVVHLFERECSIQRRHQKLVEEAPSAVLTPALRAAMGSAAVDVAKACDYIGVGTVEFLLDAQHNFYFLEMNTRLQVEHPVTELITGLDLVKEQIWVAEGKALRFAQSDLNIIGHAIELRVCAEDPTNNFLPNIGKLTTYQPPRGTGIRVDDGYEEGMDIPIYYDNLLAKLIVHGADRTEAINRLKRAIKDFHITGVATTLEFGLFVLNHEKFVIGDFDTNFIGNYFTAEALNMENEAEASIAALVAAHLLQAKPQATVTQTATNTRSRWRDRALN